MAFKKERIDSNLKKVRSYPKGTLKLCKKRRYLKAYLA